MSIEFQNLGLDNYLEVLREKWFEVPLGTKDRVSTKELLTMGDSKLLGIWTRARTGSTTGDGFSVRGWYHLVYAPVLQGMRVLDVGSGVGIDAITFAQNGAKVTCLDIAETNLEVVRRVSGLLGLRSIDFVYLESEASIDSLRPGYDFVWCNGSLINAPIGVIRQEAQALVKHLKVGGRWVELGYPRSRWVREGSLGFDRWGDKTDGGAPWIEWYDLEKLLSVLSPAKFKPVFDFEFHNGDFNWVDLLRDT